MTGLLFSLENAKAEKAIKFGWLNAIQYLAPYDLAGVGNLCPHSTPECRALCLGVTSGHAGIGEQKTNKVIAARIRRAQWFMKDRKAYLAALVSEIDWLKSKAKKLGLNLCVRLNGSSDIAWEGIAVERDGKRHANIFEAFPELVFVDYTKNPRRMFKNLPANYHLTFSRSENNDADCSKVLANGGNVAVVFKRGTMPKHWLSARVIDGDEHDLRFLDPAGVVVGLSPKGRPANKGNWGFIVDGRGA